MNSSCAAFGHVVHDRLLLAQHLQVDSDIVEQVSDRIRLGLDLIHELAPGVD